ncbi:DUF2157 domain-containing protein [Bizionia argentinensis JUB59]|uniref:DUF2157 domain-containing protein n=1 Tax=Bizionia argentinensis JUB59 TaxID=1046627 RepID=G2EH08_9FLAO|nr:DUF2157 domain-containing protein [Bizionia argentinensis]EGV42298.1 DUF2157 domain-containing protein [Bizionia argentinensis JUB59]
MAKINREDIHIISRHSNWLEISIKNTLNQDVYNDKDAWYKFLKLFFISLGVGFTTAGIIFFFAYNWADLHKFIKIGLIEALIIIIIGTILVSKFQPLIKNILLTGASVIVGVLFAVFGQIYQTGANAYDFFLGWTLFIALWVLVSNFAPLWLVFITLINTTLILYAEQVAQNWSNLFLFTLLFGINTILLILALAGKKFSSEIKIPKWFTNTLSIASITFCTIGICLGIFDDYQADFYLLIIPASLLYGLGIWYGLKIKSGFYLSIIPFSIIIITSALLLRLSDDFGMLLLICLFIIVSVTSVIANLFKLQKKWIN